MTDDLLPWLAALPCLSFTLSKNEDSAVNHQSVAKWLDSAPVVLEDEPAASVAEMRATGEAWCLQIYLRTPIGSEVFWGGSAESVIRQAQRALAAPKT